MAGVLRRCLPCFLVAIASVPTAWAMRSSSRSTPVEKVISLLGRLSEQISREGKNEAAEYDKYACFCKEQASAKTHSIERSEEKIAALTAEINALDAAITDLNTDVAALGQKASDAEAKIVQEQADRQTALDNYVLADKNVTEAIAAVEGAIEALKASKGQMKGAKLNLLQVQEAASRALSMLAQASRSSPSNELIAMATALLEKAAGAGGQPAYEYQSNDIIGLLQKLLVQFKARKQSLFEDEHALKSASEKKVLSLQNEKKFAEKEKVEKEAIASAKMEDKQQAMLDSQAEANARDADAAFREELKGQCEAKAQEWDQRSQTRAQELTALSEAVELLKSGVNPNYGANKKLVGLSERRVLAKAHIDPAQLEHSAKRPVSFLQESHGGSGTATAAIVERAMQGLQDAAGRLASPRLSALAAKALLKADNFVKVRGLIKDLISRLEAEASAEANQKTFCDQEMAKAIASRDKEKVNMEKESAAISKEGARKAQLKQDIARLSDEIAGLSKALNEATELRSEEKRDNQMTIEDANAGKQAVEQAITVLKNFYGSLLQQAAPPAGADREGNAVSDLAPTLSYSGSYSGKADASKGILGLLEVILADFERTVSAVGTAESDAASKFTTFESDTRSAMSAKSTERDNKEAGVAAAEVAITTAQDALKDAERLHALSEEELKQLSASCVEGEESWAERKAKREQEIAALKQALAILENWQG